MHWLFWTGVVLVLVALLPTIGLTFGIVPIFAGTPLVLIAVLGGYFIAYHKHRR